MLSTLQTVAASILLGCVAIAFPDSETPTPPAPQSQALCTESAAPQGYLPPEPWIPACPSAAEKKLAAR
jgi:hypothetical protein